MKYIVVEPILLTFPTPQDSYDRIIPAGSLIKILDGTIYFYNDDIVDGVLWHESITIPSAIRLWLAQGKISPWQIFS